MIEAVYIQKTLKSDCIFSSKPHLLVNTDCKTLKSTKSSCLRVFDELEKNLVEIKEQIDEKRQHFHSMTHPAEGLDGETGMFV